MENQKDMLVVVAQIVPEGRLYDPEFVVCFLNPVGVVLVELLGLINFVLFGYQELK